MKLPPYAVFPEIAADQIVLRQVLPGDMKDIFSIQFYDGVAAKDEAAAIAMQRQIDNDYNQGNSVHWGIADLKSDKLMGTLGYYRGFERGVGELGCVLMEEYRGKGIMTAAMQLAIDFGINYMNLNKITAITSRQNSKAAQLLERLGFVATAVKEEDMLEYEWRAQAQD